MYEAYGSVEFSHARANVKSFATTSYLRADEEQIFVELSEGESSYRVFSTWNDQYGYRSDAR